MFTIFANSGYKIVGGVAVEERAASVASVTRHLEQLNVEKDEKELSTKGDAPSVIIPDHLQVQSADCSHLSFGSFGSGMRIPHLSSVAASSLTIESAREEAQAEAGDPSVDHADPRYIIWLPLVMDDLHAHSGVCEYTCCIKT